MSLYRRSVLHCLEGASALALMTCASIAYAKPVHDRVEIDLPAQSLGESIIALGVATHRIIAADDTVLSGLTAPALNGKYTAEEALDFLLAPSHLRYRRSGDTLLIRKGAVAADAEKDITVTGTRIRGAEPTSAVISLDRSDIIDAGQTSMADVIHSLPQSSGGGANPGIGIGVPGINGVDFGAMSTANLRGLGSDATLTLFNGHRVGLGSTRSAVDISEVPLGLVEKVEVVADGSSALYGSDAVGGVVNVLFRRNLDHVETRIDMGGTTGGGGFRQQYGVVGGKQWQSGGIVTAVEYASSSRIWSNQREVTSNHANVTVQPPTRRIAVGTVAHQALTDTLTFEVDAIFNHRYSLTEVPTNASNDLYTSRIERNFFTHSFSVAPALKLALGHDWQAALTGVYGREHIKYRQDRFADDVLTEVTNICYCSTFHAIEATANGTVLPLPGGEVRAALGAGYRTNSLTVDQGAGNEYNMSASQGAYSVYGEVEIPLIAQAQDVWGVRRLSVNAALRYERYPGIDNVATPKLGLIFSPVRDVTFKGNWGKSFLAPTLYQLYQKQTAGLYNATSLGGTSGTAIYVSGGNPDLKPERATSWSLTGEFTPSFVPGLALELTFFHTRFIDRIVNPITYTSQALSDPAYARYVTRSPDATSQANAIAAADNFDNYSTGAYNASSVVALIDGRNVNAEKQIIKGLDAQADYHRQLGDLGSLNLLVNGTYLDSTQQLTQDSGTTRLAGTLYNPPHWRARGGLTWSSQGASVNATMSRIGGVTDSRTATSIHVHGMTTLDLAVRYAFGDVHGPLSGVSFGVTAQNLFNAQPDRIATSNFYDVSFDSTNYSAVGRFVGLSLEKSW